MEVAIFVFLAKLGMHWQHSALEKDSAEPSWRSRAVHCGAPAAEGAAEDDEGAAGQGEGATVLYGKKFRKIPKNPENSQKWACAARFARVARPFLEFSRNFLEFSGWMFFSVRYCTASLGLSETASIFKRAPV